MTINPRNPCPKNDLFIGKRIFPGKMKGKEESEFTKTGFTLFLIQYF